MTCCNRSMDAARGRGQHENVIRRAASRASIGALTGAAAMFLGAPLRMHRYRELQSRLRAMAYRNVDREADQP